MTSSNRSGLGVLGFGAAACAVCCAGPILAFLGGIGVLGLASTVVIGWIGLLLVAAAIVALIVVRRRRSACVPPVETVAVASPTRCSPRTTDHR